MIWQAAGNAVFRETKMAWGMLSNMAPSPLLVEGIEFRTAEALYQCCRFPDHPNIQQAIIASKSPMSAKMVTKPWRHLTRSGWEQGERVDVMRWTLRIKFQQSADFRAVLQSSEKRQIIESSRRDGFWGAIPDANDPNLLHGNNTLGILLMELRDAPGDMTEIAPPPLKNFLLLGKTVGATTFARTTLL